LPWAAAEIENVALALKISAVSNLHISNLLIVLLNLGVISGGAKQRPSEYTGRVAQR
jgi:hypothetical protein